VTNISKGFKTVAQRHTISFNPNTKWSIVCVNLGDIAKNVFKIDAHQINSIQLCG